MSPKLIGASLGRTLPVEPSPPRGSGWPSANTRHPPTKAHSAGGWDWEAAGVGIGLGLAVVGPPATGAGDGGKTRSHGLTTAAPRKMPITKVRIGTARETPPEPTGSMRTSSRCSFTATGPTTPASAPPSDLPEVGTPDVRVRREDLGIVGEDDAPGLEHVAAVGDVERLQRVLLDEQDRGARGR